MRFALAFFISLFLWADDEKALLKAIQKNPDEDTPRLMYADWLEENAQSEADRARAEFIRLQCALFQRTDRKSPEYARLRARSKELLEKFGIGWTPEPMQNLTRAESFENRSPFFPGGGRVIWRRGFIEGFSLFGHELTRAMAAAVDRLPALDHLKLRGGAWSSEFLKLEAMGRIRGLSLEVIVNDAQWEEISKRTTNLERLHLALGGLTRSGIVEVVRGPHASNLSALSFETASRPGIAEALSPLWRDNKLTRLETLGFKDYSSVSPEWASPSDWSTSMPSLRNLELRATTVEDVAFLVAHPRFRSIRGLKVGIDYARVSADDLLRDIRLRGRDLTDLELSIAGSSIPAELLEHVERNRVRLNCQDVVSAVSASD